MIPYSRQTITDEDVESVSSILSSDYLTTGPSITAFETALCNTTNSKFAIACSNGTTALHLACLALGVKNNDIGLTSSISFVASANCLEMCGATSSFIDIDDRYCLDPNLLEDYCKKNKAPKVVIGVDFAGFPAKWSELKYLANKYNFYLIDDASHSIGTKYKIDSNWHSIGCGIHADITTFSFHPVKNITTGEGGAVLTNDEQLAEKIRLLRGHGIQRDPAQMSQYDGGWYYQMQDLGFNYRITDFQCALGLSQLKRLEESKKRKIEIAEVYNNAFKDFDLIEIPPIIMDAEINYHLYPILIKSGSAARKYLYDYLKEQKILCQVHYIPIHTQPYYKNKYSFKTGDFPKSEMYYDKCLSIPMFSSLGNDEQLFIIEQIKIGLEKYNHSIKT